MGCILPGVLHYFIIFYILWVVRIWLWWIFCHSRKKPRFILLHPPNQWVVPWHFHGPRSCLGTCSSVVGAISWRHVETDLIQKERKTKQEKHRWLIHWTNLNKSKKQIIPPKKTNKHTGTTTTTTTTRLRRTSQFTRGHDFDDGGFAVFLCGACLAQRVPDLIDRINGDAY